MNEFEAAMQRADALMRENRWAEAGDIYAQLADAVLPFHQQQPDNQQVALFFANLCNSAGLASYRSGQFAQGAKFIRHSLEASRRVLGEEHPDTLTSINNLAGCLRAMGRSAEAIDLFLKGLAGEARLFQRLRAQPESIRRSHLRQYNTTLPLTVSLVLANPQTEKERLVLLFTEVVRRHRAEAELQAAPQDALLLERYPHMSESIQRRQMLQEQIGRLYLTDRLGNFLLIREMEAGVQAIERGLLPNIPELREERREVDHRAIALSLPSQGLLLEYLRYHRYDFASKSWAEERYAVFTLEQGAEGKLAIHDLGEAEPIDRLIQTFRHMARHMGSGRAKNAQRMSVAEVKAKEFREAIEEVAELVWNPLGDVVRNRRVVVVPDGEVAMVPFDLFVGAGSVTYLAASADLIERKGDRSATSHASPLVIGDPNYHFTGEAITATATTETIEATATAHPTPQETPKIGHEETQETARSLFREAASGLTRLPGTRLEVYRTARLLGVEAVVWDDAQTAILRQRRAPSSLIIAAHGLAMEDMALLHPAEGPGGVSMRSLIGHLESALDPLQRCGIALAGAGNFLKSTSRDASAQDGFLTGQKITALDLRGTDVILSCCNTNVVVRRDGRGLLGLRTALFHAGARSLILTLWPISDFATGPFMEELCRRRYTEKQGAEVALKGTKDYLRTLTIGEMKRGYWLSEEARETLCELRKGSAGHPDDEAVFDKTLAEMDDLRQRPNTDCPFADPLYWAAFVLYGDPIAQVD